MTIKKTLKITGWVVLGIVSIVPIYLLSAYTLSRISVDREAGSGNDVAVYLITNGVHTDLVLPARSRHINWTDEIKYSNTKSKDTTAAYVAFGWGDKGFYLETPTWADLKASVACRAACGYGSSAMHATFYKHVREDSTSVKIMMSNAQYSRLVSYIKGSFRTDDGQHFINIPTNANYGNSDAFYEAKGSYSIFHTCNTWTNNALKSCGQKACLWTPFDTGLFYQYGR
ncbi:TIGR02117 family protein [Mucilaginibacter gynuensis]